MASDGVRKGFDLRQLSAVRAVCRVPLVASGGAGAAQHFTDVFQTARVDAALAASVFHSGELDIATLKAGLRAQGIEAQTLANAYLAIDGKTGQKIEALIPSQPVTAPTNPVSERFEKRPRMK